MTFPPPSFALSSSRMSGQQVAKLIFGLIAVFATFVTANRLTEGNYVEALWPGLIVGFCVWRLWVMMDNESD